MGSERGKRVGDRIREEICDLLLRKVKDPRIGFVTVTGVDLSPNLRFAKVYYSLLGTQEDRQRAEQGLKSASGFIKRELGARLQLKFVPDIVFLFDESLEYGDRMERILRELQGESGEER
jgi:ribosome-binding factor A